MRLNDFKDFLAAKGMNEDLVGEVRKYLKRLTQNEIDYLSLDVHDEINVFQHMEVATTWADFARELGIRGWVRAYFYIHDYMWACSKLIDTYDPAVRDNYPDNYMEAFNEWSYLTGKIEAIVGKQNTHEFWQSCLPDLMRDFVNVAERRNPAERDEAERD